MKTLLWLPLLFCLFIAQFALAEVAVYPGYTNDVESEKQERFQEVFLSVTMPSQDKSLQEMIFNPLATEFKERYRDRFGQVDTESLVYKQTNFGILDENTPSEATLAENQKRRDFAEYMTRRLVEFHFDKYMRTQPQMRPVMEVKEKIQNIKVEVTKETRLNINYNFAGNILDLILDNPYCDSRMSLEMDPKAWGPSDPREVHAWVGKNLNSVWRTNSHITYNDGIAYADLVRSFPKLHMSTSFGYSTFFREVGASTRQSNYLIGLSHSY